MLPNANPPPRPNQQKKHSKEKKKYHRFHLSSTIPHQPDNILAMNNEKMVSHQRKKNHDSLSLERKNFDVV